jgi:hypothetical protein
LGNPSMKSMDKSCHALFGTGNGLSSLGDLQFSCLAC